MTCVSPPELADHQLLAHLDGEAGPEVEAHLVRCPYCRGRAQELAAVHALVSAKLHRLDCPDAHELGEYHLGLLPGKRAAAIREHLASCPHCAREVAQLEGYLEDLAPDISTSPFRRLRVLVAQLFAPQERLRPPDRLVPVPAYAVRGTDEGPRLYRVEGFQVAVETQEDAAAPEHYTLLVLVTGAGFETLEARLNREGLPVARMRVDDLGNLIFNALTPGEYDLVLRGADVEIQVPQIPVGPQSEDAPQEANP